MRNFFVVSCNAPAFLAAYQRILQDMDMERAALQEKLTSALRENDMVRVSVWGELWGSGMDVRNRVGVVTPSSVHHIAPTHSSPSACRVPFGTLSFEHKCSEQSRRLIPNWRLKRTVRPSTHR